MKEKNHAYSAKNIFNPLNKNLFYHKFKICCFYFKKKKFLQKIFDFYIIERKKISIINI